MFCCYFYSFILLFSFCTDCIIPFLTFTFNSTMQCIICILVLHFQQVILDNNTTSPVCVTLLLYSESGCVFQHSLLPLVWGLNFSFPIFLLKSLKMRSLFHLNLLFKLLCVIKCSSQEGNCGRSINTFQVSSDTEPRQATAQRTETAKNTAHRNQTAVSRTVVFFLYAHDLFHAQRLCF